MQLALAIPQLGKVFKPLRLATDSAFLNISTFYP